MSSNNQLEQLLSLIPQEGLEVGTVLNVLNGTQVRVTLPTGSIIAVRGEGYLVGARVLMKGNYIVGTAPDLPSTTINRQI